MKTRGAKCLFQNFQLSEGISVLSSGAVADRIHVLLTGLKFSVCSPSLLHIWANASVFLKIISVLAGTFPLLGLLSFYLMGGCKFQTTDPPMWSAEAKLQQLSDSFVKRSPK